MWEHKGKGERGIYTQQWKWNREAGLPILPQKKICITTLRPARGHNYNQETKEREKRDLLVSPLRLKFSEPVNASAVDASGAEILDYNADGVA
jgi:hypothetical protein